MRKSIKNAGKEHMERMREHFEETGIDLSSSGCFARERDLAAFSAREEGADNSTAVQKNKDTGEKDISGGNHTL